MEIETDLLFAKMMRPKTEKYYCRQLYLHYHRCQKFIIYFRVDGKSVQCKGTLTLPISHMQY